jgi:pyridoxamine 5'-phosphate oxidase family protein
MSVFTEKEIEYILSQRLGRLATIRPDGTPQIAPVGFHYNAEHDVIEIGGRFMSRSKKFHNIQRNPNVAFVIDDVLPPWQPRFVEIRGTAQPLPTGGKALFGTNYEADDAIATLVRSGLTDGFEIRVRSAAIVWPVRVGHQQARSGVRSAPRTRVKRVLNAGA